MAKPVGNNGSEELYGGGLLDGGNGQDILWGAEGPDTLNGENGKDILIAGNEWHYGEDIPEGGPLPDVLNGNNGNDILYGGEDAWVDSYYYYDYYTYISDVDIVVYGDQLNGGRGNDVLYGSNGGDTLTGGNGDDQLHSGLFMNYSYEYESYDPEYDFYYYDAYSERTAAADVLDGGKGDDVLYVDGVYGYWDAEAGTYAILTGGEGYDTFNFAGLYYDDGPSNFGTIVEITDFASGIDKIAFEDNGNNDYWLFEPGTDPGEYVEDLTEAGSLSELGTAAAAAHDTGADYYFGVFEGDGYLVVDDIGDGWGTVIKLTGVTDMDGSDIVVVI